MINGYQFIFQTTEFKSKNFMSALTLFNKTYWM